MKNRFLFLMLFLPLVFLACGGDDDKSGDGCGDAACGCGCGESDNGDDPLSGPTEADQQAIESLTSLTKQFLAELKAIKSLDSAKLAAPKLKALGGKITKIGWGKGKELLVNSKSWSKDAIVKWMPKLKALAKTSLGIWNEKRRIKKDATLQEELSEVLSEQKPG